MDKEVLQVILKKLARESEVASVINVEAVPALPKGENYTSTILRVILTVVLGNGRKAKKSFIMKQVNTAGKSGEWFKESDVAKYEGYIYSVVHKEMTYLMEEYQDTQEPLWCNLIYYDTQSSIFLLEDLKSTGYSTVPRQEGLDLNHALHALTGLGRYHGMAKVLEERGIISKEYFKPNVLQTDFKVVKNFLHAGILNTSKVILECWGPTWEEIGKKMNIPFEAFFEKYNILNKIQETEFTVLNHGDCWSNNLMFKYDFQKRPIALKFLDYQFPNYNSPCVDISDSIYLSIPPAIRRQNYGLLLKTYHDSLINSLDKFGFSGKKPTLEEIISAMERRRFFGLTLFITAYAGLVGSATTAFDIDKLLETEGKDGFDEEVLKEPGIIDKIGPDLIDFVEKHLKDLPTCLNKI